MECGKELSIDIHEGVYGSIGGPTYESPSDSLWCQKAGMDSVGNLWSDFAINRYFTIHLIINSNKLGMSTTHEAVVAVYCGMKTLAFSIITDMVSCEYYNQVHTDHEEILKIANAKAKQSEALVALFLKKIKENQSLMN